MKFKYFNIKKMDESILIKKNNLDDMINIFVSKYAKNNSPSKYILHSPNKNNNHSQIIK